MKTTIGKKLFATLAFVLTFIVFPSAASAGIVENFGWDMGKMQTNANTVGISTTTPTGIIANIIAYALAIIGFLGVLGFIIAGIMYLVSAGDEDQAKTAKSYMINSIIGIIIALLGFVVMAAISNLLTGNGSYL